MPILNVKKSIEKSPEAVVAISDMLLELTSSILGKKREVTAIAIQFINPDSWVIGGRLLSEQKKSSFYFDIKITDETNTKDEKARYISAVYEGRPQKRSATPFSYKVSQCPKKFRTNNFSPKNA
jgi:4-oxalocrotonate tautomerase